MTLHAEVDAYRRPDPAHAENQPDRDRDRGAHPVGHFQRARHAVRGAIICAAWVGLVASGACPHIAKFDAPANSLDSYHYLKAFQGWLKNRMARSKRLQRHLYAVTFIALAIGMGESAGGQPLIRLIVESNPGLRLVYGVPLILIVGVVVIAIVVELFGGAIFDFDVNTVYRNVFRKLDEMVAEMEELRG